MKEMKDQQLTGSRRQLAEMLNLSERRITDLITAGIMPARGPSGFDLTASVRGYIDFLKTQTGDLKTERTRCAKLKADLLDLQVKARTGKLVERAAVERQVFTLCRRLRDQFLNLPNRIDALVAAEPDRHKCFDIVSREVRLILDNLSGFKKIGEA